MDPRRLARALNEPMTPEEPPHVTGGGVTVRIEGATGSVYTVFLGAPSWCTCKDHEMREVVCKHMYFALVRLLGVEEDGELLMGARSFDAGEVARLKDMARAARAQSD